MTKYSCSYNVPTVIYIYLVYGLAFIVMGSLIALQGNVPNAILPRLSLVLLALFGFVHGINEWVDMLIPELPPVAQVPLNRIGLGLITVSFAFLASAGVELLIGIHAWPGRTRILTASLIPLWTITILVSAYLANRLSPQMLSIGKPLARYLIAFPGAIITGYAFWRASKIPSVPVQAKLKFYLRATAVSFFLYAVFAGLIPESSPLFPSPWLTADSFYATTGIPIILLRAICAVAISIFLSQAFIIELANRSAYQKLRDEYLSLVAHDLRTPLTVILTTTQLLERSWASKPDQVPFWCANIGTSARNLDRMIENLLDTSLIESNRLILERRPINLYSLIREIAERIQPAYPEHALNIRVPKGEAVVNADTQRIEQVLLNLISNAAKYSDPRAPITIEAAVRAPEVIVSVTNQGTTIPADERPYLFKRYYQGQRREKKGSGIGLGLYIVKGLIEAHEGHVWLEPREGNLTTFRFSLPLMRVQ